MLVDLPGLHDPFDDGVVLGADLKPGPQAEDGVPLLDCIAVQVAKGLSMVPGSGFHQTVSWISVGRSLRSLSRIYVSNCSAERTGNSLGSYSVLDGIENNGVLPAITALKNYICLFSYLLDGFRAGAICPVDKHELVFLEEQLHLQPGHSLLPPGKLQASIRVHGTAADQQLISGYLADVQQLGFLPYEVEDRPFIPGNLDHHLRIDSSHPG
jgi:hypothetical protein